jgi:uncharacterized protein (DUF2252 family)
MNAVSEPVEVGRGTPKERAAAGLGARALAPRSSHAEWEPAADRRDPVKILVEQVRGRVPELLPYRYGRMLASPFAFYRGAAAIMAADLASTPASGLRAQLCGDAHISNFGTFSSPERAQLFDISDFDETLPGPWEWDVKRLAASVCIAGRGRDFNKKQRRTAVLETVAAYRETMATFAGRGNRAVWYAQLNIDGISRLSGDGFDDKDVRAIVRQLTGAGLATSASAVEKLTETVDGVVGFRHEPPDTVPVEDLVADASRGTVDGNVRTLLSGYGASLPESRRTLLDGYRYVAVARRVPGVGSVGVRIWALLLHGRDARDPLLLQAKEAGPSVLESQLEPSAFGSHAERVVTGQRLMQATGDIFLGGVEARSPDGGARGRKRAYYVRQLADHKGSVDVEKKLAPGGLAALGRLCGWTLARAHARTGDRIAIAGYLGGGDVFDRAIADFGERYADQNDADFEALRAAAASRRVPAIKE